MRTDDAAETPPIAKYFSLRHSRSDFIAKLIIILMMVLGAVGIGIILWGGVYRVFGSGVFGMSQMEQILLATIISAIVVAGMAIHALGYLERVERFYRDGGVADD